MYSVILVYTYEKLAYQNGVTDAYCRFLSAPTLEQAYARARKHEDALSKMGEPSDWFSFIVEEKKP